MALTRRGMLLATSGLALAGAGGWLLRPAPSSAGRPVMTPADVLAAMQAGDVVLIDVRQPQEWTETGIAEGAVPIDLRRDDFVDAVRAAVPKGLDVAVICARGVRSRRMQRRLSEAGLRAVFDVPEGMLGGPAGPGWIAAGLPLVRWEG